MKNSNNEYVIPASGKATDIDSPADYKSYKSILEKYPFVILIPKPKFDIINNWLVENLDNKAYIRFGNIYCFKSDSDKILFSIRWA